MITDVMERIIVVSLRADIRMLGRWTRVSRAVYCVAGRVWPWVFREGLYSPFPGDAARFNRYINGWAADTDFLATGLSVYVRHRQLLFEIWVRKVYSGSKIVW